MKSPDVKQFKQAKFGNSPDEYEDASTIFSYPAAQQSQPFLRLALADGATTSSFALIWAKMLVHAFRYSRFFTSETFENTLKCLGEKWYRRISKYNLPWYAEEKVRMGAFATFLGLEFFENPDVSPSSGTWSALGLGDSCFFQIRQDMLIMAWPLFEPEAFNNYPKLLSSNFLNNRFSLERPDNENNSWENGDIFILATDALSHWFLNSYKIGQKPWKEWIMLQQGTDDFLNWATQKVSNRELKNDDLTCLIIEL